MSDSELSELEDEFFDEDTDMQETGEDAGQYDEDDDASMSDLECES